MSDVSLSLWRTSFLSEHPNANDFDRMMSVLAACMIKNRDFDQILEFIVTQVFTPFSYDECELVRGIEQKFISEDQEEEQGGEEDGDKVRDHVLFNIRRIHSYLSNCFFVLIQGWSGFYDTPFQQYIVNQSTQILVEKLAPIIYAKITDEEVSPREQEENIHEMMRQFMTCTRREYNMYVEQIVS